MKRLISALAALAVLLLSAPALAAQIAPTIGHESDVFSMDTAMYALALAAPQTAESAASSFAEMGYEILRQENYAKPASDRSHTSAYTVAAREMEVRNETRTLVVISVRGTGDGEWFSNFDFASEGRGDCAYAENFMTASRAIFDAARANIEAYENPVVLATGYSRGGACANLLGVLLDEAYGEEDVYVYSFATPNTVHTAEVDYPNIFNLVNVNDAVTRMPLSAWGFRRAGVDIELRDPVYVNTALHEMILSLLGVCPDIDSYYADRHSLTAPGLAPDGVTFFELFQAVAAAMTEGEAASDAGQLLQTALAAPNDFTQPLSLFMNPDTSTDGFLGQHAPSIYLRLMDAYGVKGQSPMRSSPSLFHFHRECCIMNAEQRRGRDIHEL